LLLLTQKILSDFVALEKGYAAPVAPAARPPDLTSQTHGPVNAVAAHDTTAGRKSGAEAAAVQRGSWWLARRRGETRSRPRRPVDTAG